jgi:hypothetical protein
MRTVVGSQYGTTTGATESLIAQLHSHGKLTTPRRENRKIVYENEILKATNGAIRSRNFSLPIDTKNICANLVRLSL